MLLLLFTFCCHHRTTVVIWLFLFLLLRCRIVISVDVVIVSACGRGVCFVCCLCYYWRRLRRPRPDNPREPLTRWCPSQHAVFTAEVALLPWPPMEMMYFHSLSIAFRRSRNRSRSGGEGINLLDMSIGCVYILQLKTSSWWIEVSRRLWNIPLATLDVLYVCDLCVIHTNKRERERICSVCRDYPLGG